MIKKDPLQFETFQKAGQALEIENQILTIPMDKQKLKLKQNARLNRLGFTPDEIMYPDQAKIDAGWNKARKGL